MSPRLLALCFSMLTPLLAVAPAAAAVIVVDTLDDTDVADGDCSLREAIRAANLDQPYRGCATGAGADRVEFAVTGRIDLGDDLPAVRDDLFVDGPGADDLIVHGGDQHRIFLLEGPTDDLRLTLRRLTVRNGLNPGRGGCVTGGRGNHLDVADLRVLACTSAAEGGGIAGDGARTITVRRTLVRNCHADLGGGGIIVFGEDLEPLAHGGFITSFTIADTTVDGSTVSGIAAAGGGAVVLAQGTIARSTFSGNETASAGGGLVVIAADVVLVDSTFTENVADTDDDEEEGIGGGLFVISSGEDVATLTLRNTIIAGNFDGDEDGDLGIDPAAGVISLGFNFVGANVGATNPFPAGRPNLNGDFVGTIAQPLDADLDVLDEYGGPMPTHLPLAGSAVVDLGSCPAAASDQRGFGNPATGRRAVDIPGAPDEDDGCDIGAVERGAVLLTDEIFADGLESGNFSAWSSVVP